MNLIIICGVPNLQLESYSADSAGFIIQAINMFVSEEMIILFSFIYFVFFHHFIGVKTARGCVSDGKTGHLQSCSFDSRLPGSS